MRFRLLRLGDNPVIALPCGSRREKFSSLARINAFTPKRWMFVQAMRAAVAAGVDAAFTEMTRSPLDGYPDFDLPKLLATLGEPLGVEIAFAAMLWPWPPSDYRGRVYVHAFDQAGRPVAFCKVSLHKTQDANLENEAKMLAALGPRQIPRVRVPAVVADGSVCGLRYLAVEAIPTNFRSAPDSYPLLTALLDEFRDLCKVRAEDLVELPWWREITEASREYRWLTGNLKSIIRESGLDVSLVHGDYSAKNVIQHGTTFFILDWETGALRAPLLTDHVSCAIAQARRGPNDDPKRLFRHLQDRFAEPYGWERHDFATALFYLAGAGNRAARKLLDYWEATQQSIEQR